MHNRPRARPPVSPFIEAVFPRAARYSPAGGALTPAVREPPSPDFSAFLYSERHLKCVWFDDSLRPSALKTETQESVGVESPGRWNLEAGPDFLDATLRIGPERRRVTGDVEIHVHPHDWVRHGHLGDPRYARVIAHVTFFPAHLTEESLPRHVLQVPLLQPLRANPRFSFDAVDLAAYPYANRAQTPPCRRRLAAWNPDRVMALLEAAGEERLKRKAERMDLAIREKGRDQVFYEEVLCALGYKHNRVPMRCLSEVLPVHRLSEASGNDPLAAYAILLGVAGLLPSREDPRWSDETLSWIRRLWDLWWKQEAGWRAQVLPATAWKPNNLRPQNHPRRRLMAAAVWFCTPNGLLLSLRQAAGESAGPWLTRLLTRLQLSRHPFSYWNHHLSLLGRRLPKPVGILGEDRASALLTNVLLPFFAAQGTLPAAGAAAWLGNLPVEEENSLVRQAAHGLLGPDFNRALYRTGLRQQGLLQIVHDYCLNDRSGCRECPFPALLDA
ncbi:MAG: DUF2851 family protein [Lentisphaerae bacterium]|nr:DUF2851 family protein [Lentisphaerota bacterium]